MTHQLLKTSAVYLLCLIMGNAQHAVTEGGSAKPSRSDWKVNGVKDQHRLTVRLSSDE